MASVPKIAIIGAGPAGLTLARLIYVSKCKVDFTIYELDASPTARPDQGGTLDLHEKDGLAAIRKCGLWDSFTKHARYDGEQLIMADKNGTILVHLTGGDRNRPEIDRKELKEILVESVPEEFVKWGWHLREVMKDGRLRFDGRAELEGPFDLVVGADGAWSKVRAKLSGIKPVYSGVSGYEMEIKNPSKTCSDLDKRAGRGSFFGICDRKFLNTQRMGSGILKVRSWFVCPEAEAKDLLERDGKERTLEKILTKYAGWAPEMTEPLPQASLDTLTPWTLYELPVGSFWDHQKGFTLIGDASSLATPFSGEGVNKAMQDSLELAELIEKSQDLKNDFTLDEAVSRYEQEMFPRAKRIQEITQEQKQNVFVRLDSPLGLFTGMMRMMAKDSQSVLMKVTGTLPVTAAVYSFIWLRIQIGWAVRRFWRKI